MEAAREAGGKAPGNNNNNNRLSKEIKYLRKKSNEMKARAKRGDIELAD